jgi:hypothetical protein
MRINSERGLSNGLIDSSESKRSLARRICAEYSGLRETFDLEIRDIIHRYSRFRKKHEFQSLPISAYVPIYLGEAFDIGDPTVLCGAGVANFCFDDYAQMIDDATDMDRDTSGIITHASTLLLLKGLSIFLNLGSNPIVLYEKWKSYMEEASAGERYLWRHHGTITSYDESDFKKMGERGALAKVSAALFADLAGNKTLLETLEEAIEANSTGIQILDDLVDWREDLRSKIYTLPLVLAHDRLGARILTSSREAVIGEALFYEGIGEDVLSLARKYFARARELFERVCALSLVDLSDECIAKIDEATIAISNVRIETEAKLLDGIDLTEYICKIMNPKLQH